MRALDQELRYGYTLADLNRLARVAVAKAHARGMDYTDRYDTAWSAIAETLCEAPARPDSGSLILTGMGAVRDVVRVHLATRGYDQRDPYGGQGSAPKWAQYWAMHRHPTGSPENAIVDLLALTQIWAALTPVNRRALQALADMGDPHTAAAHLEMTHGSYTQRLVRARKQFLELWHEHETPSRLWGKDRYGCTGRTATRTLAIRQRRRDYRAAAKKCAA